MLYMTHPWKADHQKIQAILVHVMLSTQRGLLELSPDTYKEVTGLNIKITFDFII